MSETIAESVCWDEDQLAAIAAGCDVTRRVVPITGAAGTGKTALKQAIYQKLTDAGYSVALIDPTGRAAKRTQEVTGIQSSTMHRKLEYTHPGERDPVTGRVIDTSFPRRDKRNPLEEDVIIADEYAMFNQEMHRNFFDSLKPAARAIVLGDMNQLAPIEDSERLKAMPTAFSKLLHDFDGINLKTIHRQGAGSGIVKNGLSILKGIPPRKYDDFTMNITEKPLDALEDHVYAKLEAGVNFASIEHQIICLQHSSWVGTTKLNLQLQAMFGTGRKEYIDVEQHTWKKMDKLRIYVGDKVMQTTNNYNLEIYNGETGIVMAVTDFGEIDVDFGDRMISIPPEEIRLGARGAYAADPRKDLELAYAVTTHKVQGSEYKQVVYIMNKSAGWLQSRRNFYTGESRAREFCHVITDQRSLAKSLNNKG